jgi:diguanylate cyclase
LSVQPHSIEKAKELANTALERILREGLTPTPECYELWYVYFANSNTEVVRAIDILIANDQKITDDRCHELHQRFLSDALETERVRKAGDKVQETIKTVSGAVGKVKEATTKYNVALESVSGQIKDNMTPKEMATLLTNVKQNTKDMMSQNLKLEDELVKSSMAMVELQRDLEEVRKEALTDGLTNLANRKAFDQEIQRIVHEAMEEGTAFSLILMDIDHFKSFNDNFGHQVGDQVLRLVARTLIEGIKGKDVAARYGGEEFAIILPVTNIQAAVKVGDGLRKAVASKDVVNRNSGEKLGRITLSGGVAQYLAGESIEDLIERADNALYTAKHNGRNQIAAAPAPGQKKAVQ